MPVANIPLLDYMIDYLSDNNIEEVYILCTIFHKEISEYIKKQRYKSYKNLKITSIMCKGASSPCGALRSLLENYVDSPLVSEDFVVLRGDMITNVPLEKAIKEHMERKAKNIKCMITKTFVQMCHANRLRTQEDDILVVTDPGEKLIVQYNQFHSFLFLDLK